MIWWKIVERSSGKVLGHISTPGKRNDLNEFGTAKVKAAKKYRRDTLEISCIESPAPWRGR